MDEIEILKETLNATLQRHNRLSAAYEVEIANLTAEIISLRQALNALSEDGTAAESGGSLSLD